MLLRIFIIVYRSCVIINVNVVLAEIFADANFLTVHNLSASISKHASCIIIFLPLVSTILSDLKKLRYAKKAGWLLVLLLDEAVM